MPTVGTCFVIGKPFVGTIFTQHMFSFTIQFNQQVTNFKITQANRTPVTQVRLICFKMFELFQSTL